jgi:hypothetical protein
MSKQSNASDGIGLGGVLFCIFLVLKLTGHIDWSWWWVTSPLWIPFGIFLAIVVVVFGVWAVAQMVQK